MEFELLLMRTTMFRLGGGQMMNLKSKMIKILCTFGGSQPLLRMHAGKEGFIVLLTDGCVYEEKA